MFSPGVVRKKGRKHGVGYYPDRSEDGLRAENVFGKPPTAVPPTPIRFSSPLPVREPLSARVGSSVGTRPMAAPSLGTPKRSGAPTPTRRPPAPPRVVESGDSWTIRGGFGSKASSPVQERENTNPPRTPKQSTPPMRPSGGMRGASFSSPVFRFTSPAPVESQAAASAAAAAGGASWVPRASTSQSSVPRFSMGHVPMRRKGAPYVHRSGNAGKESSGEEFGQKTDEYFVGGEENGGGRKEYFVGGEENGGGRLNQKVNFVGGEEDGGGRPIQKEEEEEEEEGDVLEREKREVMRLKEGGTVAYREGRFEEARDMYGAALAIDPTQAVLWANRGAARLMLGDAEGCAGDCRAALVREPKYTKARLRLSRALVALGDIEAAQTELAESTLCARDARWKGSSGGREPLVKEIATLRASLETAVSLLKRAKTALESNDGVLTKQLCLQARPIIPTSIDNAIMLVQACKLLHEFDQAANFARQHLPTTLAGLGNRDGNVYCGPVRSGGASVGEEMLFVELCLCLWCCDEDGEFSTLAGMGGRLSSVDARSILERVRLAATESAAHKGAGNAAFRSGKWADAVRAYTEALRHLPSSGAVTNPLLRARVLGNRAAALVHQGRLEAAVEDCRRALASNPLHVRARLRRARASLALGNAAAAAHDLDTAANDMASGFPEFRAGKWTPEEIDAVREEAAAAHAHKRAESQPYFQTGTSSSSSSPPQNNPFSGASSSSSQYNPFSGASSSSPSSSTNSQHRNSARRRKHQQQHSSRRAHSTPKPPPVPPAVKRTPVKNLYSVLGVPVSARSPDIRKAFRKLARTLHPDKAPASEDPAKRAERESRFRAVAEAYEILSDPDTRKQHDRALQTSHF